MIQQQRSVSTIGMEHQAPEAGRKPRAGRTMVDRGTRPAREYQDILEENRLLFQELCLAQAELEMRNEELRRLKNDSGKQVEMALRQSEQRAHEAKYLLQLVLDTIPVRLFWKDLTSTYLGCNRLFARDAGFEVPEELIGLDDYDMGWKEQADRYRNDDFKVMTSGKPKLHYEELQTTPEGKQIWLSTSKVPLRDASGAIIGVLGVYDDITSRKQVEEDLLKARHLESLGSLASGIAHDFNNILMITMGHISLAKEHFAPTEKGYDLLTLAEESILKAKELTRQFLSFSQGGSPITRSVAIAKLIKVYSHFTLNRTRSTCELVAPDDLWPVEADEGQIGQVLTNILINADQAMEEGGTIGIGCENTVVTEEDDLPLAAGQYVKISIKDQGRGITREYLDKVFDPYFTTRETGCGLGLASAYSIMKKHGGHITVESAAGEGSTFTLFLPASPPPVSTAAAEAAAVRYGNGKILVLADDPLVLKILGTILGTLGYVAEFARDGDQALEKYRQARQSDEPFDAVLMDVLVPGGSEGQATVTNLLTVDPQAKVIVSSGCHDDAIGADYARHGFSGVITKPYRLSELNRRIRQILHG